MARSKLHRLAVVALAAICVLALTTTTASAAPPAKPAAPAATVTVVPDSSCLPAYMMTAEQRAALPNGLRQCARSTAGASGVHPNSGTRQGNININTSVVSFNADYYWSTKYHVALSGAALRDVNCDGRSVFADVRDRDGFQAEYKNGLGCMHTATYPNITLSNPRGMNWIQMLTYACSTTCSSVSYSGHYNNPLWG